MTILNYFSLFCIGGALYSIAEVLWRGYTHPSMAVLGGICFVAIFLINIHLKSNIYVKAALSCVFITIAEFLAGCFLNLYLHLSVWDYSAAPLNILGQVCLPYSIIWYILSLAVLWCFNFFEKVFS